MVVLVTDQQHFILSDTELLTLIRQCRDRSPFFYSLKCKRVGIILQLYLTILRKSVVTTKKYGGWGSLQEKILRETSFSTGCSVWRKFFSTRLNFPNLGVEVKGASCSPAVTTEYLIAGELAYGNNMPANCLNVCNCFARAIDMLWKKHGRAGGCCEMTPHLGPRVRREVKGQGWLRQNQKIQSLHHCCTPCSSHRHRMPHRLQELGCFLMAKYKVIVFTVSFLIALNVMLRSIKVYIQI